MSIIVDELKREIHKIKMQLSEQIEENVRLKGFKALVMEEPEKYESKRTYKTKQEHGNDLSFENDTRLNGGEIERLTAEKVALYAEVKRLKNLDETNQKTIHELRRDNKILAEDK
tara:strand:- start:241 stop:585 length:345 start_codon:yes stop_codon:yes gene_type:complete